MFWRTEADSPEAIETLIKAYDRHDQLRFYRSALAKENHELAIQKKIEKSARFLGRYLKSMSEKNQESYLLFTQAIEAGEEEKVKKLIEDGAFVNSRSEEGKSPLHIALEVDRPNKKILELLLRNGADFRAKDKSGTTPLDIANNDMNAPAVILIENIAKDRQKTLLESTKNNRMTSEEAKQRLRKPYHYIVRAEAGHLVVDYINEDEKVVTKKLEDWLKSTYRESVDSPWQLMNK